MISEYTPFFPEIVDILQDKVSSMPGRWIYMVLATCFPVDEDWEGSDGKWIAGTIFAKKQEIMKTSGVSSKGGFYKAWPDLLGSGLVIDNGDGSFTLPKFKKPEHQAIFPILLQERLSRLEAANKWHPCPTEVVQALKNVHDSCWCVYFSLVHDFYVEEDWEGEGEWVIGKVTVTKAALIEKSEISNERLFYRRAWPDLQKAGLIVDNHDGTVTMPTLKRKVDEAISVADIKDLKDMRSGN